MCNYYAEINSEAKHKSKYGKGLPLHLYRDIFNANVEVPKPEENQKQFKSDLNKITRGNP